MNCSLCLRISGRLSRGSTSFAGDMAMGVEVAVIPRRAHRPDFFGYGEGELLLSPASVDLAGVVVAPSPEDFNRKLTAEWLEALFRQTCY